MEEKDKASKKESLFSILTKDQTQKFEMQEPISPVDKKQNEEERLLFEQDLLCKNKQL